MLSVSEISNFNVTLDNRCIIDFTDAGEVGYRFGFGPDDTLKKKKKIGTSIFEIICADRHGQGNYEYWQQRIKPNITGTGTCVILGDYLRTPKLMEMFSYYEGQGLSTWRDTLQSLVTWLRQQGYETIELVVTRKNMGSSLEKAISTLK